MGERAFTGDRMLKVKDVCALTALSRATIYRLEGKGAFPDRVHLTQCAVAWRESEIAAWIASRVYGNAVA